MTEGPLKGVLNHLFTQLSSEEHKERSGLVDCWPEIVGGKISARTKPSFSADNRVWVRVDDSVLAFELSHRYKTTILKRLQNQFGEEKVKDIRFIVGEIR
jgi:hypothetical protein